MNATCAGPGCDRPAVAHGLCWAHVKQKQRGEALRPLHQRAMSLEAADLLLKAAAIAFADSPRECEPAAFEELLRAVEVRKRALGQRAAASKAISKDAAP